MKDQTSNNHEHNRIPWNFIVQIILALVFFYLLGLLMTSLSFAGRNGIDIQATQVTSSLEIFDNFGFKVFDTKWNESIWAEVGSGSHIEQLDGLLILRVQAGHEFAVGSEVVIHGLAHAGDDAGFRRLETHLAAFPDIVGQRFFWQ